MSEGRRLQARQDLAREAVNILDGVFDYLKSNVLQVLPVATIRDTRIFHDNALLYVTVPSPNRLIGEGAFPNSGWDVLLGGKVGVAQHVPEYHWTASLWHMDLIDGRGFRWYEVSYFIQPFSPGRDAYEPFALEAARDADLAASVAQHTFGIAFGPALIDNEAMEEFASRWVMLFVKATNGEMSKPSFLPIK